MTSKLITVSELADELGVSAERVRQLIVDAEKRVGREIGFKAPSGWILDEADADAVRDERTKKRKYQKAS